MKYITIILSLLFAPFLVAQEKPQPRPQVGKKQPIDEVKRPERKPFPKHWGDPPRLQTKDFRPLPHGFGMGSSTLAKWIVKNLKQDKEDGVLPPRPERPKPSPELQAKIKVLQDKKKELRVAHSGLSDELKGKSKEDAVELIKAFKEANKDKHLAIKEAHQELIKSIREKKQTGGRRE